MKVITISENEVKKQLYAILDREAERRGEKIISFGASIIEEALKQRNKYDETLNEPLPRETGTRIVIRVPKEVKDQFTIWAQEKKRTQSRHAAYILEKWHELNNGENKTSSKN